MQYKQRSEQIFGGVFLIGLAVLFIVQSFWWPGIMFVIGIAMLARTISEGKSWSSDRGALVVLAIGILSALPIWGGNWFPLLLIAVGAYMLFGEQLGLRGDHKHDDDVIQSSEKTKNDTL